MVIDGFAVTIWGEPRFTSDLDVTLSVPPDELSDRIRTLCASFTPLVQDADRFVSETRVLPMLVGNVPVDAIFAALPYEDEAIARAKAIPVNGIPVRICSPEDLILHKIVSSRPRDREDIEGIFRYRHSELDHAYLDPRVEELATALDDRTMLDWYQRLVERWRT